MKPISTLIFILFFGAMALAQNTNDDVKVETLKMGIVLDSGFTAVDPGVEASTPQPSEVARLYKFKNTRIKKALAFTTKRNKARMA